MDSLTFGTNILLRHLTFRFFILMDFFGGFKLYFLYLLEITYLYLIKDENKGFDDFNQVLLFDIRSYFNSNITPLQPRIVVHPFQLTFLKHIFKYKSIEMLDISPRLLLRMIIQHYEDHS